MILVFGDAAASLCPTPPPMNEESCETEGVSVAFFVKGIILIRSFRRGRIISDFKANKSCFYSINLIKPSYS